MSRVIRVSISMDFYPDEDEFITEDLSEEQQEEYYRDLFVEDIYSYTKFGNVWEATNVEVIHEANV